MKLGKALWGAHLTLTVMMVLLQAGAVYANEFDWNAHMQRNEERVRRLMQNPQRNVWVDDIDPALEFVSGYTGLGSDILTIGTANDIASVWPAWNTLSPYVERYALVMLAYDCINDVFAGNANAAAWKLTKFAYGKFLSNMSAGGPIYAAYISLIDFGLDYLGNAVVAQVRDDYWRAYCEFHFKTEKKDLSTLLKAFETGGLGGLERSLDSFWSDPASAGIRGYYTQKVHDPDYKQNFRWRFIREFMAAELLKSLDEKRTEIFLKQRQAAREMAEQMERTKVRVTVPVVERGTGQPAKGYTATLSVRTRAGMETLAAVPVDGKPEVVLEFPYTALLTGDHISGSTPSFHISIVPDEGTSGKSPQRYFNLFGSSRRAELTVSAQLIEYRVRHSFEVNSHFSVTIKVDGKLPAHRSATVILRPFDTIRSHGVGQEAISLYGNPSRDSVGAPGGGGDGGMPEGWVEEGTIQNGIARFSQIPAGRYWFEILDTFHGPYVIDQAAEFSIHHVGVTASAAGSIHAEPPAKKEVTALAQEMVPAISELDGTLQQHLALINEAGAEIWARFMAAASAAKRDSEAWRLRANEVSGHDEQSNRLRRDANEKARQRREDHSRLLAEMNNAHRNLLETIQSASAKALEGQIEIESERELMREYNELRHAHRDQNIQPLQQIQSELLRGFWQRQPNPEAQLEAAEAALDAVRATAEKTSQTRSTLTTAAAATRRGGEHNARVTDFFQDSVMIHGMRRYTRPADQLEAAAAQLARNEMLLDAEEASRQVERYRQRIESRRRMERRMRELLAQIDEALAALPEIEPAEWSAAFNDFSEKHKALIAALQDSVTSDDEDDPWKSLQEKTEQWLLARVDFCGDILPEPLRTENSFSEFFDLLNAVKPFSSPYVPREWFGAYRATYNSKVASRNQAVEPLVELRNEIAMVAAITPAADRAAELQRRITAAEALISPDKKATGQERIDELAKAKTIISDIPQSMLGGLPDAWNAARRELVQDGTLERLARASGQPYIVIESYNDNPVDKPFFWPEKVDGEPRHELVLRLENVPVGDFAMVNWYLNEAYKNPARQEGRTFTINAYLQQASNFRLDVMLSEGELFQNEIFPAVLFGTVKN